MVLINLIASDKSSPFGEYEKREFVSILSVSLNEELMIIVDFGFCFDWEQMKGFESVKLYWFSMSSENILSWWIELLRIFVCRVQSPFFHWRKYFNLSFPSNQFWWNCLIKQIFSAAYNLKLCWVNEIEVSNRFDISQNGVHF